MRKQIILTLLAVTLVTGFVLFQSGSTNIVTAARPSETITYENVTFVNDVQPILERRCTKCHGGEFPSEGLKLESYESLMAGSQNGGVIIVGDANNSLIIQKLESGEMPKRGQHLTTEQIELIRQWINEGALNN
jgi:uncharacterized membrane protein